MNTLAHNNSFSFTAATFNLRAIQFPDLRSKWGKRCELISDQINKTKASIVGVQEMLPIMKYDLRRRLSEYSFTGCGRSYRKKHGLICGEHTDILTLNGIAHCTLGETFWLSKQPDKPGSRLMLSLFPRICTVADIELDRCGSTVRVYNTHLDHISRRVRRFQINVILKHMELTMKTDRRPVILMGDFNTTPDSDEIKLITSNPAVGLRAAYNGSDFSFKYPALFGGRLFDYIFVSDDITVDDAYIDCSHYHGSDHYPLIASLSINNDGGNSND
nr:endonuclease/exonuclease/phosphatase family protein [Clostridia bacterium]